MAKRKEVMKMVVERTGEGQLNKATEALIVSWQNTDKKDRKVIQADLEPHLEGLGFFELNDLANELVGRGVALDRKGDTVAGEELVVLAGFVRSRIIGLLNQCGCVGG